MVLGHVTAARAHPHVWITARAGLHFEAGLLTAIELDWSFDEFFSQYVKDNYDADKNGKLDAAESMKVRDEAFVGLEEDDYLTHLRIDEVVVKPKTATDFVASLEGGVVSYRFTLPLPEPVDVHSHKVTVTFFDSTYYIDVAMADKAPVAFTGVAPEGCKFRLHEDAAHPIYFGLVNPLAVTIACAATQ